METWKRHHVDSKFTKISIQLTRESKTGGDSAHSGRHEMVQVTIGRSGQLQGTEADVIHSLGVKAEGLVGVFNQLMNGQGSIVRFNDCV